MTQIQIAIAILILLYFIQSNRENFYPYLGGYFVTGASGKYGYGGLARYPNMARNWGGRYWRGPNFTHGEHNRYPYFW